MSDRTAGFRVLTDRDQPISLEGRRARLRPVTPDDYEALYEICLDPAIAFRWRFGGGSISFDDFCERLWDGVHVQYVVERMSDRTLAGLQISYNVNWRDGYTFVASILDTRFHRQIWASEGGALFISYLFRSFPLRKIYGESAGFNVGQFSSGLDSLFIEEARLRQQVFHDGRYWDQYVHAIYPDAWFNTDFFGPRRQSRS